VEAVRRTMEILPRERWQPTRLEEFNSLRNYKGTIFFIFLRLYLLNIII